MRYAKGIMWLDDCRIPFVDETDKGKSVPGGKVSYTDESWGQQAGLEKTLQEKREPNTQGRFTPNLLVCDDMLNDGSITQGTKTKVIEGLNKGYEGWGMNKKKLVEKSDKGTNSRYYDLDKWFDKVIENL
jgi:hypothetical protein